MLLSSKFGSVCFNNRGLVSAYSNVNSSLIRHAQYSIRCRKTECVAFPSLC